jgi:cytochrome c-type biogenesis protein
MTPSDLAVSFFAGLLSPLGAACILPLYPGYLSFLAAQAGEVRTPRARILLGIIAGTGIMAAMLGFGLVVGVLFTLPIGGVLSVVSPIAYAILGGIGILLILGAGPGLSFRIPDVMTGRTPFGGAFLFGLFFGVLILPCNAGPVTVLLALSTSAADFASNMGNFLMYGAGMAIPLIILSALSSYEGTRITRTLAAQKRWINFATGVLMIAVAAYYLLVVFRIQEGVVPLQNTSLLPEGSR